MKRKTATLTALAAMVLFASISVSAADTNARGDADNNGYVDLLDAVKIKDYVDGGEELTNLSYSDINNDGTVDSQDAAYVLKTISGKYTIPEAIKHEIVLSDNNITADGTTESSVYAEIDNEANTLTIISPGTYNISGELTNGQIIVNIPDTYTYNNVELNLKGVTLTNTSGPAIYGLSGDLEISATKEYTNTLTDGTPTVFETEISDDGTVTTTDEPDACIFSHDGISLKGKGVLNVNGKYANGISGKDEVEIKNLTLNVSAVTNAIKGSDSVDITSGTLELVSKEGDGIRCTKGNVTVNDGSISINAADNGIFAKAADINISGGTLNINVLPETTADTDTYNYDGIHTKVGNISITGGNITTDTYCDGIQSAGELIVNGTAEINVTTEAEIASSSSEQSGPGQGSFGPGQQQQQDSQEEDSISAKGLKAGTDMTLDGGAVINVTYSADDSIHSDGNVTINNATLDLSAGDDGVHAEDTLTFNEGCNVRVNKSYEGIEAETININGGQVVVYADDDMVNAAGGNDSSSSNGQWGDPSSSSASGNININGGYLYCVNTKDGDGIDSNGSITMTGGTVIVNGVSGNTSNSSIDYDGTFAYSGGDLFAVGGGGNMAQSVTSNSSTAYVLTYGMSSSGSGFGGNNHGQQSSSSSSISAGTRLTLTDSNGNVIMTMVPENGVENIIMGSSNIKKGSTYTLYSGGTYSTETDAQNYGTGGTLTGGTKIASGTVSGIVTALS
ncbi:MAG: carbohydrate-binding domain-containing protein [Firmicutes bacterium]|nr:carbohydrate-binding domain-containing protein [Bacillota bacterium]